MNRPPSSPTRPMAAGTIAHRRGGAYVAVLGMGMLVVAIGLGAIASVRARAIATDLNSDISQARMLARSAIEQGRAIITRDTSWRSNRSNGEWVTKQPIGAGSMSLSVLNPSGPLNRSSSDPVTLTGVGYKGRAVQKMSVQLEPAQTPLTCLGVAMASNGLPTFTSATLSGNGGTVASNVGFTSVLSSIDANVQAVGLIAGTGYLRSTTAGVAAKTMPDAAAFDYYISTGTTIDFTSIPYSGANRTIQNVLLSPMSSPYGRPDECGVYIIDCALQALIITNCRIVGTLVLLNPGIGTAVQGSVNWAPAVSNYPCLMVRGDCAIKPTATSLAESVAVGVNYNPTGTPYPYPSGTTNTSTTNTYPSVFDGMVYVSGTATIANAPSIDLLVVGGTVVAGGTLNLNYDARYLAMPPPGFYTNDMRVARGTWRKVVD